MFEATLPCRQSATTEPAARLVRLLAATVDILSEDWDALSGEPAMRSAAAIAGVALVSLACDAVPEAVQQALRDLSATVVRLPEP